jgi:hypothetical protein
MHECEEAREAKERITNPLFNDLGPSHYLQEITYGEKSVVRCIYCGEIWAEWECDGEEKA